jgi:uncharacterized membrane protein YkoI
MIRRILPILAAALVMGAGNLAAQQRAAAVTVHEAKPGLLAQATVKSDAAQSAAQAEAKTGKITSGQIEERANKLVYVYKVESKKGRAHEVVVDAKTGMVVKPMRARTAAAPRPAAKK